MVDKANNLSTITDELCPRLFGFISLHHEPLLWSCLGGIILSGYSVYVQQNRPVEKKLSFIKSLGYFFLLFSTFPILGMIVSSLYISNGDKLGSILSFQLGLTSPSIIKGMLVSKANKMKDQPIDLAEND